MNAPDRLKAWRAEQHLSQEAAALLAGFTQGAWGNYETGRVPMLGHAIAIQRITEGSRYQVCVGDWAPLIAVQRIERRERRALKKHRASRSNGAAR